MELQEYLKEYKALTLDIMEEVNYLGNIKEMVNEREYILSKIKQINFTKEEICKASDELNLFELEDEMMMLIKKEKVNIKKKIANLKKMQKGNTQYLNYRNRDIVAFDRFDKRS